MTYPDGYHFDLFWLTCCQYPHVGNQKSIFFWQTDQRWMLLLIFNQVHLLPATNSNRLFSLFQQLTPDRTDKPFKTGLKDRLIFIAFAFDCNLPGCLVLPKPRTAYPRLPSVRWHRRSEYGPSWLWSEIVRRENLDDGRQPPLICHCNSMRSSSH